MSRVGGEKRVTKEVKDLGLYGIATQRANFRLSNFAVIFGKMRWLFPLEEGLQILEKEKKKMKGEPVCPRDNIAELQEERKMSPNGA